MPTPPYADRLALLIGINDYPQLPKLPKLRGCVNDVELMSTVLQQRFGYGPGSITKFVDTGATGAAVRAALRQITATANHDTAIYLYFSGFDYKRTREHEREHTQQGLMLYGGPDECLFFGEILDWLKGLSTTDVVIVLDTCYTAPLLGLRATRDDEAICLGASADAAAYEYIAESGTAHGAFSYHLGQAIMRAAAGATYTQIFSEVTTQIASLFPGQHPRLEGNGDRPMFAIETFGKAPVVLSRKDHEVQLDVGAAAGVTAHSLWAVYPRNDDEVAAGATKKGTLEISDVRGADCSARIFSEASGPAIAVGDRVIEEAHNYGEMRLRVATDEASAASLREVLQKSELLRLVMPSETADVTVRRFVSETGTQPGSDSRASALDKPLWVSEDQQRRAVLPPTSDLYSVRTGLEKLARQRNVLALVNPNLRGSLAGKLDLVVKRAYGGSWDSWTAVEADREIGIPVLYEEDKIRIEIVNRSTERVFVNIFDMPTNGTVILLFEESEIIEAHKQHIVEVGFYFPHEIDRPSFVETLKAFVTVYPIDLNGIMRREGMRYTRGDSEGFTTELGLLMDMALTGRGSRERRSVQLPPGQEWTTSQYTFELRRGGR
jgi:Caspase domain